MRQTVQLRQVLAIVYCCQTGQSGKTMGSPTAQSCITNTHKKNRCLRFRQSILRDPRNDATKSGFDVVDRFEVGVAHARARAGVMHCDHVLTQSFDGRDEKKEKETKKRRERESTTGTAIQMYRAGNCRVHLCSFWWTADAKAGPDGSVRSQYWMIERLKQRSRPSDVLTQPQRTLETVHCLKRR